MTEQTSSDGSIDQGAEAATSSAAKSQNKVEVTNQGILAPLTAEDPHKALVTLSEATPAQPWNPEKDPFTEEAYEDANKKLDSANIGERVEIPSMREAFDRSTSIALYPSLAIGDTLFMTTSFLEGFDQYFTLHPKESKPIEIFTQHAALLEGLKEKYPHLQITITALEKTTAASYTDAALASLNSRPDTFAITSYHGDSLNKLQNSSHDQLTALIDASIFRYRDGLQTWNFNGDPQLPVASYAARTIRMLEMMLGERFAANPTQSHIEFPLSQDIQDIAGGVREDLESIFNTKDVNLHCIVPSSNLEAKQFTPQQTIEIARNMAENFRIAASSGIGVDSARIVILLDPNILPSELIAYNQALDQLPEELKRYIQPLKIPDLTRVAAMLSLAESVVSTDTGVGQMAALIGRKTVLVHTVADPHLWKVDEPNVAVVATDEAEEAYRENRALYDPAWTSETQIQQWRGKKAKGSSALSIDSIMQAWRGLQAA